MNLDAMIVAVFSVILMIFNYENLDLACAWAVAFTGWTSLAFSKN
jgi:hypothetical protein